MPTSSVLQKCFKICVFDVAGGIRQNASNGPGGFGGRGGSGDGKGAMTIIIVL